jgi:hypothetical protein
LRIAHKTHWAKWPQEFIVGPRTMYYWYKMALFDELPKGKYEAETISMDYIIFSDF